MLAFLSFVVSLAIGVFFGHVAHTLTNPDPVFAVIFAAMSITALYIPWCQARTWIRENRCRPDCPVCKSLAHTR